MKLIGIFRAKAGYYISGLLDCIAYNPQKNTVEKVKSATVILQTSPSLPSGMIHTQSEEKPESWLIAQSVSQEALEEVRWKLLLLENKKWLAMLNETSLETKPSWFFTAKSRAASSAKARSLPGTREYEEIFQREYLYNSRRLSMEAVKVEEVLLPSPRL